LRLQVVVHAGRVLKGRGPTCRCSITKIELIIRLKGAKALGTPLPLTPLGYAGEVIE
jgi:hypothetical protein